MGSSESSLSESQVQDMINDNVVSLKDGVSVDDICSNFLNEPTTYAIVYDYGESCDPTLMNRNNTYLVQNCVTGEIVSKGE